MEGGSVWVLADPRPRLKVFLDPYQPEAKPRADMDPETPETEAEDPLKPIQTCLPCYNKFIVCFSWSPFY